MASFSHLNNEEFRQELINNGIQCGPIGATTRNLYEKKLLKKLSEGKKKQNLSLSKKDSFNTSQNFNSSIMGSSRNFSQKKLMEEEEEEDDHTESSRIISPKFKPSRTYSGNFTTGRKSVSPINKAWGFFSRSLGSSTPCSDFDYYNKYTKKIQKK
jgi:hypothetical protein